MNIKELLSELLQFQKKENGLNLKKIGLNQLHLVNMFLRFQMLQRWQEKNLLISFGGVYKDYKRAVELFKVAAEHGVNQAIGALIRAVKEYKDHQPTA